MDKTTNEQGKIKASAMLLPLEKFTLGQTTISVVFDPRRHNDKLTEWKQLPDLTDTDLQGLRKDKNLPTIPIVVRVMKHGKCKYFRTGISVTAVQFHDMRTAKGNSALAKIKKDVLRVFDHVCQETRELQAEERFSFDKLRESVTGKTAVSFAELWQSMNSQKKENTTESYNYALRLWCEYAGRNIAYHDITTEKINGWKKWMQEGGRGDTTIGMHLRAIKVPIREAIKRGYIKDINNPMQGVKIPKSNKRTYEFIDIPTINKLRAYKGDTVLEEAVAMWVFSYLTGGANMADIVELRYDDFYFQTEGRDLKFTRQKTADTTQDIAEILIPLHGEIKTIIDKYGSKPMRGARVFPQLLGYGYEDSKNATAARVRQANQNIRKRLYKVCKALDLAVEVSPSWARHSFKTNAVHKGIDNIYIEMAMGHSLAGVQSNYMGQWRWEDRAKFVDILLEDVDIYYMNRESRQITADEIKKYLANLSVAEKRALLGL